MMPDREKVIKALEFCTDQRIVDTCYGECPYAVADDEYKCLQMKLDALALLKNCEPVEVLHHEAPYGYPFNTGRCPVCFQELDEGDNFCRSCGKAVKWE